MLKVLQDSTLSAMGDVIRTKAFTESKFTPSEMTSMIRDYMVGYDQIAQASQIYARGMAKSIASAAFAGFSSTIVGAEFPECSAVGASAFYNCQVLSAVSMPKCETIGSSAFMACSRLPVAGVGSPSAIGDYAFANCTTLADIDLTSCVTLGAYAMANTRVSVPSLPLCTTIGAGCFQSCRSMVSLDAPVCTTIGSSAFDRCSSLTTVNAMSCNSVGSSAFYYCTSLAVVNMSPVTIDSAAFNHCSNLTTIGLERAVTLGRDAFAYCSKLASVSLAMANLISDWCFQSCVALTTISLPRITQIYATAFSGCTALSEVFITGNLTQLSNYAFASCKKLERLYLLRADSTVSMRYSTAIWYSPMDNPNYIGTYGSVYVPDHLYEYYPTLGSWSYFSQRLASVGTVPSLSYDAFSSMSFAAMSGVSVSSWSASDGRLAMTGVETSAGHEGFNIVLGVHEPYVLHEVEFDFTFTDAQFIGTSYRCGWFLTQGVKSDYTNYSTWPENLPRDSGTHHQLWRIMPTGSTFCATFCLDGLSDSHENVFEISNMTVRTATWDI